MQTKRTPNFADIDYALVVAEAKAERSKTINLMFRQARAYVAGLFSAHGAAAASN